MSEMNVKTGNPVDNNENAIKDYKNNFMPQVHRIGRGTMAVAFVISFLPVLYFVLVRGFTAPLSAYANVMVAIASIGIGMWLTEPLAYWPVLGSAGTYIGYLSGNVGAMRFPVALSLQSTMDADINSPRGQVVTIVGIVASVFMNLIILIIIVLSGGWLITVLPAVVIASFSFVMIGLFATMLIMRWNGKTGLIKGFLGSLPFLITAVVIKLFIDYIAKFLSSWGVAISVAACVIVAYFIYRRDCRLDAEKEVNGKEE